MIEDHDAARRAEVRVRPVAASDAVELGRVLRAVMAEVGAAGCGFSSEDAELDDMPAAYAEPRHAFFVAERAGGLLGGAGVAPLRGGADEVCELRKMYLVADARGLGLGRRLLAICLDAARTHGFRRCYLETREAMGDARRLYEAAGFVRTDGPWGDTGHSGCDIAYALDLDGTNGR